MIALLAAGLLYAQAPARDAPPPTGTAAIRGRVTVAGADRPLSRVIVHAICTPLKVDKAVLTDANGRYEIAELPAGRYTVSFSRTNFVRASYGQRRPLGPGGTIDLANGQVLPRIDAMLQLAGVITGRVVDQFGDPMTGVQVMPMRYAYINGERRLQQQTGMSGFSNDLGEYRVYGLAPGHNFVSAVLRDSGSGGTSDRAYTATYYPGTPNAAEAQRLTIASGQTVAAINMTLLPVVAVHVTGSAMDSRGRPMAGANIQLSQRIGSGIYGSSYGRVRADGTFRLSGVAPGDYSLSASMAGAPDEIAAVDLTVSESDVSDVQLAAVRLSVIRGRIAFAPGALKPPAPSVMRLSVTHPASLSAVNGNEIPRDDGTFEIKTSAGHAMLRVGAFGNGDWHLNRVLGPDGVDVTDAGFDVPAGVTVTGFVVELTSRITELTGTVIDATGAAVRDCVVVLFAQDPLHWSAQTRYLGISRPHEDNVFHVRVPAGQYYAAAFALDDQFVSLGDPEILQQLRERATTTSIGDGERKLLTLTLIEPPVF